MQGAQEAHLPTPKIGFYVDGCKANRKESEVIEQVVAKIVF